MMGMRRFVEWTAVTVLALLPATLGGGPSPTTALLQRLKELEDFIDQVSQEQMALNQQVQSALAAEQQTVDKLREVQTKTLPDFDAVGTQQNNRLEKIRMQIQNVMGLFAPLDNALAGQEAISKLNEECNKPLGRQLDELRSINNKQSATLVRLSTTLNEAKEKVKEKTEVRAARSLSNVREVNSRTMAATSFMNSRQCYQDTAMVVVDPETGEGTAEVMYSPEGLFQGAVPSAVCVLEAFQSDLELGAPQQPTRFSRTSQQQSDSRKHVALSVNCQPQTDRIQVKVTDQSLGADNSVTKAYITFRACALNAMV